MGDIAEKHLVVGRVIAGHTILKAMYKLPMLNGKPISSAFIEFPPGKIVSQPPTPLLCALRAPVICSLRIGRLGFGTWGDRKWPLNEA